MAWNGEAQVDVDGEVFVTIVVRKDNTVWATFTEAVDVSHLGVQIKYDTLEQDDEEQPVPVEMRGSPETCILVLRTPTDLIPIGNFERLSKFRNYFDGTDVSLEILEPSATVSDTRLTLSDLGVHRI